MKKIFRKEVIIGILFILAGVLLFIGINFFRGMNVFSKGEPYYVVFNNVKGLTVSSPVTINGFQVGQVRSMKYDTEKPGYIRVELALDDKMSLPEGTVAQMNADLLGTASVSLLLGDSEKILPKGSELPGSTPGSMLESVSGAFPKVETLLDNTNALISDPALRQSIARLDDLTKNLVETSERLNAVMQSLPPVVNNTRRITDNFATSSEDIKSMTSNLDAVVQSVREMPLDSISGSLQATLANLEELTSTLNRKLDSDDSTAGKLLNDPELYNNINSSIEHLDSLLIDIKQNPKRYISIKLL